MWAQISVRVDSGLGVYCLTLALRHHAIHGESSRQEGSRDSPPGFGPGTGAVMMSARIDPGALACPPCGELGHVTARAPAELL